MPTNKLDPAEVRGIVAQLVERLRVKPDARPLSVAAQLAALAQSRESWSGLVRTDASTASTADSIILDK